MNDMFYSIFEMMRNNMASARFFIKWQKELLDYPYNPFKNYARPISASLEVLDRMIKNYPKPEFNIKSVMIDNHKYNIKIETVIDKPFGKLLHFKKTNLKSTQPPLIVVAPLAGHYATLCQGTVEGLLADNDIYITDWVNASYVPLREGRFGVDEYIDYLIEFINYIGPNSCVLAVCQPTVPVMVMITYLSTIGEIRNLPASMVLMGGPIDTRKSPTQVNNFATTRNMNWFEQYLITRVPVNYPGAYREVYPGFLQLSGFMALNMKRHIGEHIKLFEHLVAGDGESAEKHMKFYDEYLSVMDLPAEFYIETIEEVFQNFSLPKGEFKYKGIPIKPENIKNTALLVIEGELDDISGVGQTKAAIDLCKGLKEEDKYYHLQQGVGHYGIFNGSNYRKFIAPKITEFSHKYYNKNINKSSPNSKKKPL